MHSGDLAELASIASYFYLKNDVNVNINFAQCFLSMTMMYCRCTGKHVMRKKETDETDERKHWIYWAWCSG